MTIDLITADPDTNDPANFPAQADLAWTQLKLMIPQVNDAIEAFNFNSTNSISTTSLLISVASKSLTVETGKSFRPSQGVVIGYTTDPTQWMRGEVVSYDSGTGALVVNVRYISHTVGTYAVWTISQASIESSVEDSQILLTTGNGHGSTNTCIRLLTTTVSNTGGAFSVTHSATLGTYITINEPGIYAAKASDTRAAAAGILGLTKNSSDLVSSVSTTGNVLSNLSGSYPVVAPAAGARAHVWAIDRLDTSDIIRLHDAGLNDGVGTETRIWIRKIGNV